MNIPFVIGIGMTISVSQMVSLANGRRDAQQVSHYLFNGFCLCTLTALAISSYIGFGKDYLHNLRPGPEVVELAIPFMRLMRAFYYSNVAFHDFKAIRRRFGTHAHGDDLFAGRYADQHPAQLAANLRQLRVPPPRTGKALAGRRSLRGV